MELVAAAARIVIFTAFAVSTLQKVAAVSRFAEQIADYQVVPYRASRAAAVFVIAAEALIAALILVPATAVHASIAGAILLGAFVAAQIGVVRAGRVVSCGCFGGQGDLDRVDTHSIVRALLLAAIALAGALEGSSEMTPAVVPVAIGLVCVVFVGSELARLFADIADAQGALVGQERRD